MNLSILLADDQSKVRYALRVLLENRPGAQIVGEVDDAFELEEMLPDLAPSVIILDWMLPGLSEIGSIKTIRSLCPGIAIIALSSRPELGQEALVDGVDVFISKIDPPERLQIALDFIADGQNHQDTDIELSS